MKLNRLLFLILICVCGLFSNKTQAQTPAFGSVSQFGGTSNTNALALGIDGAPIGLEGLTKRQTKNEFKVFADSLYDEVLYQYENTAVLMFKEWQHMTDKGVEKEHVNSVLILLGKENGKWKVLADIIGREPKAPLIKKSK